MSNLTESDGPALVARVREHLAMLADHERVSFLREIQEDYCPHCGRFESGLGGCYCNRDE